MYSDIPEQQQQYSGEWALLQVHLPASSVETVAIVFRDVANDRLYFRARPNWWQLVPQECDPESWENLLSDLQQTAEEMGASTFLCWLEESACHVFQLTGRQELRFTDIDLTISSLAQDYLFTRKVLESSAREASLESPELPIQPYVPRWAYAALAASFISAIVAWGIAAERSPELHTQAVVADLRPAVLPIQATFSYQSLLLLPGLN